MIYYIQGNITYKSPTFVVLDVQGVGYQLMISLHTYALIEKKERVKLLTHFHVKEDSQTLYGFAEESERKLFTLLISVSGIGPSTAQIVLSSMTPDEVRSAIVAEDAQSFNRVKGIGPKTAKRIILDLKDKVLKDSGEDFIPQLPQDNTIRQEALSALLALGFNRTAVQKALNKILKSEPGVESVEVLIKKALQQLS